MPEDVVKETGEHWLAHPLGDSELQITNAILRRLVGSMALAIPRERLPADERDMLDAILTGP
jgi:hypothetical protein